MSLHTEQNIKDEFKQYILAGKHPCIMAKTVFMFDDFHLKVYKSLTDTSSLIKVLVDLQSYIKNYDFDSNKFESFIAVFPNNHFATEIAFENALWNALQQLHELDDCPWDESVSADPNDPNFSFSLKGKAFYIVGLHPKSSRIARQSPYTTIVFNLHWQFELLREMKRYKRVKNRIRRNELKLQVSINPVLKDFGEDTETKQYSGRNVEKEWKCPFHQNTNK